MSALSETYDVLNIVFNPFVEDFMWIYFFFELFIKTCLMTLLVETLV